MRSEVLERRTSVLVILEASQVDKIDKVGGRGNRSAYIRWLVDTIDEKNLRRELELETLNRVLQKLPMQLERKIVQLNLKILELKKRNQDLKHGKPEEDDIKGLDEVFESYVEWKKTRSGSYTERLSKEPARKWAKFRADALSMTPDELLYALEKRLIFGEKHGKPKEKKQATF